MWKTKTFEAKQGMRSILTLYYGQAGEVECRTRWPRVIRETCNEGIWESKCEATYLRMRTWVISCLYEKVSTVILYTPLVIWYGAALKQRQLRRL